MGMSKINKKETNFEYFIKLNFLKVLINLSYPSNTNQNGIILFYLIKMSIW